MLCLRPWKSFDKRRRAGDFAAMSPDFAAVAEAALGLSQSEQMRLARALLEQAEACAEVLCDGI